MKTVISLIACLILSPPNFGQTPKSEVVTIKMPEQAIFLTREQVKSFYIERGISREPFNTENHYQLGTAVISFWDYHENTTHHRNLEDIGTGMLGILKITHDTVNISKIIKINEMQFLVYEYQFNNRVTLCFQTDLHTGASFGGVIEFIKPNEDKAQKVLNDLLQSIHFKNQ